MARLPALALFVVLACGASAQVPEAPPPAPDGDACLSDLALFSAPPEMDSTRWAGAMSWGFARWGEDTAERATGGDGRYLLVLCVVYGEGDAGGVGAWVGRFSEGPDGVLEGGGVRTQIDVGECFVHTAYEPFTIGGQREGEEFAVVMTDYEEGDSDTQMEPGLRCALFALRDLATLLVDVATRIPTDPVRLPVGGGLRDLGNGLHAGIADLGD